MEDDENLDENLDETLNKAVMDIMWVLKDFRDSTRLAILAMSVAKLIQSLDIPKAEVDTVAFFASQVYSTLQADRPIQTDEDHGKPAVVRECPYCAHKMSFSAKIDGDFRDTLTVCAECSQIVLLSNDFTPRRPEQVEINLLFKEYKGLEREITHIQQMVKDTNRKNRKANG